MPYWARMMEFYESTEEGQIKILFASRSNSLNRGASMEVLLNDVYVAGAKENWKTGKVEFRGKESIVKWIKLHCIGTDYYDRERLTFRVDKIRKGRKN